MGWRVVYLDGKEGRPFVKCDTCKEIGRNVIEPAVIFVPIWKYNEYEEKKKEAEKRFVELKRRESFLRDSFQKIFKEETDNLEKIKKVCIFHCEKENEIWIENVKEYREWKERRERALKEGKVFSRDLEIKWNGVLLNEFQKKVDDYIIRSGIRSSISLYNDYSSFNFRNFIFPDFKWNIKVIYEHSQGLVDFSGSKFVGRLFFEDINFGVEVSFREVEFLKDVEFKSISFSKRVDFSEAKFHSSVTFERVTFVDGALLVKTLLKEEAKFSDISFERGLFVLSPVNSISSLIFHDFKILEHSKFYISNLRFKEKENSVVSLEIKNSILDGLKFVDCDFSHGEMEIENSSLTDVEFINIDWGEISEKRISRELFEKSPEKARDVYRQLKLALDNQKDYISANEFYSLEMKAYEKVLRRRLLPLQKKLVFLIHKFASDFGQSWLKPLVLLILLTVGEMGVQLDSSFFCAEFLYFLKSYILIALFLSLLLMIFEEWKNFSAFKEQFSVFLTWLLYVCLWGISVIFALSGFIVFKESLPCFSFNPESWQLSLKVFLEGFAQTLNIFNFFKSSQVPSEKFLHTIYSIVVTFLTYQMIVAIRRQVRR
ncbi:hypothetical protein [Desulfurobacterium crinifex]